ncbi:hypothetical protein Tco_0456098 [Tanacetum coccineum]
MESQSGTTQTVSALKLPILKSGDYDMWSMRMEQYLTHTDYALLVVIDAKTLWMQSSAGVDKTYDRFQKLISQLEIHGEVISQEDANLKLLRSLPSAWNNIALFMRNKSDLDTLSMDDLYNNLKVYEYEIKGQSSTSSNSQNVAFVSFENTSSTNEAIDTAHDVTTASSQGQASSSTYADDVMFSFFANQSISPQLDNEDLEQIDTDDLEEMDLKWALKNQGNRNKDAPRRIIPVETPTNALVVQDGIGGYDWSFQAEEGLTNFALMAYTSQVYQGLSNGIRILEAGYQLIDIDFKIGEGCNAVPRLYTGTTCPQDLIIFAGAPIIELGTLISVFRPKFDQTKAKSNPQYTLQDQGIFDSGCSRHMIENKSFLIDYQEVDGGFVAFAGSPKGGKIAGKGTDILMIYALLRSFRYSYRYSDLIVKVSHDIFLSIFDYLCDIATFALSLLSWLSYMICYYVLLNPAMLPLIFEPLTLNLCYDPFEMNFDMTLL